MEKEKKENIIRIHIPVQGEMYRNMSSSSVGNLPKSKKYFLSSDECNKQIEIYTQDKCE